MSTKLVGAADAASDRVDITNSFLVCHKFTANKSGTMSFFRVLMDASANIQVGIYTDNAGLPDVLLNSVGSTAVVAGINMIPFPDTQIVASTVYWLAFNFDTRKTIGSTTTGGTPRYKALAFGSAFPNPAGGGFSGGSPIETWNVLESGVEVGVNPNTGIRPRPFAPGLAR